VLGQRAVSGSGNNTLYAYGGPTCKTPGITPGVGSADRRRVAVAIVNCTTNNIRGNAVTDIPVKKWIDVFLVEPAIKRSKTYNHAGGTKAQEFYVEVIGQSGAGGAVIPGKTAPYLVQ
jgi:hypothetical protein